MKRALRMARSHWPLVLVLPLFGVFLCYLFRLCLAETDGYFTYILDDAYIQLAIAKNFYEHGVWGVTRFEFSSTSSAPLFTLLVTAGMFLVGNAERMPLCLNITVAAVTLIWVDTTLRRNDCPGVLRVASLLGIALLSPLAVIIFSGMEHVAHIFLSLVFVYFAAGCISQALPAGRKALLALSGLAILVGTIRYEGLFLVFAACVLLLARRRCRQAIFLGVAAVIPHIIYGIISVSLGSGILPNSLLLKGGRVPMTSLADVARWLVKGLSLFSATPHMTGLVVAMLLVWFLVRRETHSNWDRRGVAAILCLIVGLLHAVLARYGWVYRYENYIIAMELFTLGLAARSLWGRAGMLVRAHDWLAMGLSVMLCVLLIFPVVLRAYAATTVVPVASRSIYQQQIQTARFLRDTYRNECVMVRDIGAVCYFGDFKLLDPVGLGTYEVVDAKRRGVVSSEFIRDVVARADPRIAVVYPEEGPWVEGWVPVGVFRVQERTICGDPRVCFYARNQQEAARLRAALGDFARSLPKTVEVTWLLERSQSGMP